MSKSKNNKKPAARNSSKLRTAISKVLAKKAKPKKVASRKAKPTQIYSLATAVSLLLAKFKANPKLKQVTSDLCIPLPKGKPDKVRLTLDANHADDDSYRFSAYVNPNELSRVYVEEFSNFRGLRGVASRFHKQLEVELTRWLSNTKGFDEIRDRLAAEFPLANITKTRTNRYGGGLSHTYEIDLTEGERRLHVHYCGSPRNTSIQTMFIRLYGGKKYVCGTLVSNHCATAGGAMRCFDWKEYLSDYLSLTKAFLQPTVLADLPKPSSDDEEE